MSRGFEGFQGLGFRGVRFRVWGLGLFPSLGFRVFAYEAVLSKRL